MEADLGNWANNLQMLFLDALRTFKGKCLAKYGNLGSFYTNQIIRRRI